MKIPTTFSHNLQVLRKNKGVSQERLADDLDITRARIGSYEENRSEPNICTLVKIARYFEVSIDDLLIGKLIR